MTTIEKVIPTPETHRYVGMWRPPWEPILEQFRRGGGVHVVVDSPHGPNDSFHSEYSLRKCYLDGHFDVPQYVKIDPVCPAPLVPTGEQLQQVQEMVEYVTLKKRPGVTPEDAVAAGLRALTGQKDA